MMNKYFMKILPTLLAILIFSVSAYSQGESGVTFANGITVAHMTDYGNTKSREFYGSGISTSDDKLIHHQAFINETKKTYTGYDLEIIPQEDLTKFKILIKPLSIKSDGQILEGRKFTFIPLPEYAGDILIDDGDIITIDIFENPQTKEKITDFVIVTRSKNVGPRFASKHIPNDFTLDDVNLRIDKYEIKINDKSFYKSGGGGSGGNIAVYLPGKGRFIMSPFQREGYAFQKIGVITNNELAFSYGGENYKIISQSPILGLGGKWHCWILFEPDYVPKKEDGSGSGVIVQSGTIDGMFRN